MLVKTFGSAVHGVEAFPITLEVDICAGINYSIIGLADAAVKESIKRVEMAIRHVGLRMPRQHIVINLSPADMPKTGSGFDLPMAVAILAASGQIKQPKTLLNYVMMGELALDGSILPIRGILSMAIKAREIGFAGMLVSPQNAPEAGMVNQLKVYGMANLRQVVEFFNGSLESVDQVNVDTREEFYKKQNELAIDFADIKGQEGAKRAMQVAAAGGLIY